MKKVLVTGATGFIGRRLVSRLLDDGHRVHALVLPNEDPPVGVEVRRGDVTDPDSVRTAFEGVDRVIHLVACMDDWGPAELFTGITAGGTHIVLAEAARRSARAVLVSSIVIYGDAIGRDVCGEDHPFGLPMSIYGRTKQLQERIARRMEATRGLALTVVRPANVYGAGSGPWVLELIERLRKKNPVIVGKGDQNAGLVHVENVVDLLVRAALEDRAIGRTYNACDNLDITWGRYIHDLARIAGTPPPRSLPGWLASSAEKLSRFFWRRSRPPISREGLNLIGSHHRIPNDRAREELGLDLSGWNYEKGLEEIRRSQDWNSASATLDAGESGDPGGAGTGRGDISEIARGRPRPDNVDALDREDVS
jgi:nucleoside-diphosphate-sugar epimerase